MPDPNTPVADSPNPDAVGAGIDFTDPNSPLAKWYCTTTHVLTVALLGLLALAAAKFPLWHTDVWAHVKYGEWMATHRAIPDREPFSPWWDGSYPFTQMYTLTQLAMHAAFSAGERLAGGDDLSRLAGGVEMLRTLHVVLTVGRFAVLIAVFRRLTGSLKAAAFGSIAVVLLSLSNLAVFRPQTFAELGFALLLLPLSRPELSRRAVVGIPLLAVVWANGHGSYPIVFAVLAAAAAGRAVEVALRAGANAIPADRGVRRAALTLALSVVAVGVLNPYGFDLFRRTVALGSHPTLLAGVSEWQPLAFSWQLGWHWVFMASLVIIIGTQLLSNEPLRPAAWFVLLGLGVGLALQTRFVVWWAMVVPWALLPQWAGIAARRPKDPDAEPDVPTLRKTAIAVVVFAAFAMWTGPAGWLVAGTPTPVEKAVSSGTPWQVAREVRGTATDAGGVPELRKVLDANYGGRFRGSILATPMLGDYLLFALAPEVPVTYAHMHLFPPDYWTEIGAVSEGRPGWFDVLDKYGVNLIVVEAERSQRLRQHLSASKAWRIVLDETASPEKPNPFNRHLVAVRLKPITGGGAP